MGARSRKQRRSQPASGAPLSAALANGDDTLSITADCYSIAAADAALAAALLAYYTSSQWTRCWPTGRGAGCGDDQHHLGRAAGLLHLGAGRRPVGRLPHGKRAGHADAGRHRGRAAGLQDGPGPGRVHNQPNHLSAGGVPLGRRSGHGNGLEHRSRAAQPLHHRTSGRSPCQQARRHGGGLGPANSRADDGGADEVVAAIGEQILGPTDVSLSNWTVRPSSGCSVVLATHTAGAVSGRLHPDPGGEPWNIVRTYNLTPAARHRGAHVQGRQRLRPPVRQLRGQPVPGARPRCTLEAALPGRTFRRRACPTRRQ